MAIAIGHGIYIGDIDAVERTIETNSPPISAILSLLTPPLSSYASLQSLPPNIHHLFIPLDDSATASLLSTLHQSLPFIARHAACGVLVHCFHGTSRSVATVLAYLLWSEAAGSDVSQALEYVRRKYTPASPSSSFLRQLAAFASCGVHAPDVFKFGDGTLASGRQLADEILRCAQSDWRQLPRYNYAEIADYFAEIDTAHAARCRRCGQPLLARGHVIDSHRGVVSVLPIRWMHSQTQRSLGKLRCPRCSANVGHYHWSTTSAPPSSLPRFQVTVSALDWPLAWNDRTSESR